MKISKRIIFLLTISIMLIISCSKDESVEPTSSSPVIQFITANPLSIEVNGETSLRCIAFGRDSLNYNWSSQEGSFPNGDSSHIVTWKAPNFEGTYQILLTVSDGIGIAHGEISITVYEVGDGPPSPPTLISPLDLSFIASANPILQWSARSGATSYTLEVIEDLHRFYFNENVGNTTSQQINALSYIATNYRWRVNASNSHGASNWSEEWGFRIVPAPICPPTINYLGQTYNIVQIGSKCWFSENLNVGIKMDSNSPDDNQTDNGTIEKYCYDNIEENCDTYGGLYQWDEAMQYSNLEGAQGICPDGWHIPTFAELQSLGDAFGGSSNKLKAVGQGTGLGAGTNLSGFSALLAGRRYNNDGSFYFLGNNTYFWTSTEYNFDNANYMRFYGNNNEIYFDNYHKQNGFNIRCVKD